jgi:hypothetical protein
VFLFSELIESALTSNSFEIQVLSFLGSLVPFFFFRLGLYLASTPSLLSIVPVADHVSEEQHSFDDFRSTFLDSDSLLPAVMGNSSRCKRALANY